jgi:UDP:flavonoid glycosyltransferase YjiC (YdhE family)
VLLSTFGSAGDLFPLIPIIGQLRAEGHEVMVASRRGTGLYLRAAGVPTLALGDGSELRVVHDPKVFTTRFDGWTSWRRTLTGYVGPTLRVDAERVQSVIEDWRPDLVVCSGFASAARLAARRSGRVPFEVSIYPQHELLRSPARFAGNYRALAEQVAGSRVSGGLPESWLWGLPADVVLHDRTLLGDEHPDLSPVGFPYWDEIPGRPEDEDAMERQLAADGPVVVVTLGSFIGVAVEDPWRVAADAVRACGVRAVFVGAAGGWAAEQFADRDDIVRVGFVPLSKFLPAADVLIHHGGIGTTFGALAAGVPSVVLPQAFDQSFNARLVTAAGVGAGATAATLTERLSEALNGRFTPSVDAARTALIPGPIATARVVEAIEQAAEDGR